MERRRARRCSTRTRWSWACRCRARRWRGPDGTFRPRRPPAAGRTGWSASRRSRTRRGTARARSRHRCPRARPHAHRGAWSERPRRGHPSRRPDAPLHPFARRGPSRRCCSLQQGARSSTQRYEVSSRGLLATAAWGTQSIPRVRARPPPRSPVAISPTEALQISFLRFRSERRGLATPEESSKIPPRALARNVLIPGALAWREAAPPGPFARALFILSPLSSPLCLAERPPGRLAGMARRLRSVARRRRAAPPPRRTGGLRPCRGDVHAGLRVRAPLEWSLP